MKAKVLMPVFATAFMLGSCESERPVLIVGSSCMGEVTTALSESWQGDAEVQLGGTALGLSAVLNEQADIAACSRELTEQDKGVTGFKIADDAIAVAVNPKNLVNEVSSEQLKGIYTGSITNWSQIGGKESPIVVIGRESGSGTRSSFERTLEISASGHSQELPESGMIRTAVSSLDNAIGYFSLSDADESVKLLSVDNVIPTAESTRSGEYPITRPFLLVVKEDENRESIKEFIDYAIGEGQAIVRTLGYTPVLQEENGS